MAIRGDQARLCLDGIELREVRRSDADWLMDLRNDERTRVFFGQGEEIDATTHAEFVERYFAAENDDQWFVIERAGQRIGTVSLYEIDRVARSATWGRFVIAPARRGQGDGRRALELLQAHAAHLGLKELECEVLATNVAAIRLYESLGFEVTGSDGAAERECLRMCWRSRIGR